MDLVVTTAGLAAAAAASPAGPFIYLPQFKLSNGNTPAAPTDTGMSGSIVFTGVPSSFSYYDAQTVQVNLEVPADAGPFDYGDVGLFLPDGTMFARFAYEEIRHKESSLLTGYAGVIRIKALLRLSQGPAIFNLTPGDDQMVLEVATLQLVNTPSSNPENPLVIVHEPNAYQTSILLHKYDDTLWDVSNYIKVGRYQITAAPDTTHIVAAEFADFTMTPGTELGRYLIQTEGGYLRLINGFSGTTATLVGAIVTAGLVGEYVAVYEMTSVFAARLAASFNQRATVADVVAATPMRLTSSEVVHNSFSSWEFFWNALGAQIKLSANPGNLLQKIVGSSTSDPANGLFLDINAFGTATDNMAVLPGGRILQWGQQAVPNPTYPAFFTTMFPSAFPGGVFQVYGTMQSLANLNTSQNVHETEARLVSKTLSSAYWLHTSLGDELFGSAGIQYPILFWFAIGK